MFPNIIFITIATYNIIVYYPLATPTEETIELPQLDYYNGSTIYDTNTKVKPSNMILTKYILQRFVSATEV